jgi:hypothetical protein
VYCVLVVETHISTHAIPARGQSLGRTGYSMALRAIYVVSETDASSCLYFELFLFSKLQLHSVPWFFLLTT